MTQQYDQALAPAGINVNQYAILRRAQVAPRSISALALELGMDRTTLSRDLKLLSNAEWVRLRADEQDARQRLIEVTAEGLRIITLAKPLWAATQVRIESLMGCDDMASLHYALDLATGRLSA